MCAFIYEISRRSNQRKKDRENKIKMVSEISGNRLFEEKPKFFKIPKSIFVFLLIRTYLKILGVLILTKKKKLKTTLPNLTDTILFLVTPIYLKILVDLITKSNFCSARASIINREIL